MTAKLAQCLTILERRRHGVLRDTRSSVTAVLFLITIVLCGSAGSAFANELDDFQRALKAYESQSYALAATLFDGLVGGEQTRLQNRALVLESRKYLAASYLFIGQKDKASEQFVRLVREDLTYQLDPLAFPEEVQKTFAEARQKVEQERIASEEAKKRAQVEASKRITNATQDDREKLRRVLTLAETDRVELLHSRWIAVVPFGVGQFQNGDPGWGTFFAVSEGITAAVSILSYAFHESLRGQRPAPERLGEARFAESAFFYTNVVSFGLLASLVVAGLIDAQVRYQPFGTKTRKRPLPDDLRNVLKVSIGASGATAIIAF
jgi:hypothetical protein